MYRLIATLYLGSYYLLRPGRDEGVQLPIAYMDELRRLAAVDGARVPGWLIDAARTQWGERLDGMSMADAVLVRPDSDYGYSRASYELNLGCNYDCEHCYLAVKKFEGLDLAGRRRLLEIMARAGVVYLQMTGGEPMVDPLFAETYELAHELGIMRTLSTNASRLWRPDVLELLTSKPVEKITISVYGGTAEGYDKVTKRRGSFDKFYRGVTAGVAAGLRMNLNLVVTGNNAHELDAMKALADGWGLPYHVYSNISPTIYGGDEVLVAQSPDHLRRRTPFTGCNAGHTFFHADPFGVASICKVGRDPSIPLMEEGVEGLRRLGGIADQLLGRQGGCTGCTLQKTCGTCMPLVTLYRKAKAPLATYCQHR
ncbi:radical SAM protein [Micromonospora aurantiaca (nom. illeg.)]|uniref:radical SAM protein n=1 Tax=Micromonospora aurantiaca (nom. illeg.) TaxID=47850 RepID=UPI0033DECD1C